MDQQDPTTAEARDRIARRMIAALPHASALGMTLERIGQGEAEIAMDWHEDFVGDPHSGVIHGGVVSALMDTCCGAAVLAHPQAEAATAAATLDLRIDYMRGATPRQRITARARCYHVTRSVAFVRAHAFDDDAENPVAAATGAFTLER
ncbi:MAG: PaaI family thioesterase [Paracoccus sp. (in: a-proteobacteria)]|nr:PaaI family thioesterase [Paracoccus sp. (in: a-proteobacteria)]